LSECESVASLLAVPVSLRASQPRARLSVNAIIFGPKVATREGARRVEHNETFFLSHNDQEGTSAASGSDGALRWSLGKPSDSASAVAFSFAPKNGVLRVGEKTEITCSFTPRETSTYECDVPLFLDAYRELDETEETQRRVPSVKTPYSFLSVSGEGVRPRLDFDCREIVLAPTPPGVPTTRRFHLVNRGYEQDRPTRDVP
jgi:hypothetical protein